MTGSKGYHVTPLRTPPLPSTAQSAAPPQKSQCHIEEAMNPCFVPRTHILEIVERLRGNMDSFTNPMRILDFVLTPKAFDHPRRKCCISDCSEEEEGAAMGSSLAQLLMDTPEPDPETQSLVRQTDDHDGLSSLTPLEEEGNHGSWESLVDKLNDDLEALDSVASDSKDEPGPSCFCSTSVQIIDKDTKDDGYVDLRRRLGMELTEPVPRQTDWDFSSEAGFRQKMLIHGNVSQQHQFQ
ncbi:hypothetical protein UY3_07160 [Chelonia mydas]|uniref:Uncharacterized protein n=1 Tax=Chelonia mydas TaxID=8469 RepID=M7BER5_CHEMY|nr:hypothetical protein UY3_07160 [Chelonia mydas]